MNLFKKMTRLSSPFITKSLAKDSLKTLLGKGLLENAQDKNKAFNPRSFLDLKVLAKT